MLAHEQAVPSHEARATPAFPPPGSLDATIAMFRSRSAPASDPLPVQIEADPMVSLSSADTSGSCYLADGDDEDDGLTPIYRACAMVAATAVPGALDHGVRSVVSRADRILPLIAKYAEADVDGLNTLAALTDPAGDRPFVERSAIWSDPQVREQINDVFLEWHSQARDGDLIVPGSGTTDREELADACTDFFLKLMRELEG